MTSPDLSPTSPSNPSPNDSEASHGGKRGHWKRVEAKDLTQCYVAPEPEPDACEEDAQPKLALKRRQQLEQHLKSNPTDIDAFFELAAIYRTEQRPIEAKRILSQALQIYPEEEGLIWELEEATLARSVQQLREVSELAGRLDTVETDRELKRCQKDWALRRIEVCTARLRRDPSQDHLRVVLGDAMYDAERYNDAMKQLEKVLGNDDLSPAAHLTRGRCLLALKRELEAMVEFRKCALRRAVVAPLRMRVLALKELTETAERLGTTLTAQKYREHYQLAEAQAVQAQTRANRTQPAANGQAAG